MNLKLSGELVDSTRKARSLEAWLDECLILAHPDRGCKKHPSCLSCPDHINTLCRYRKR